MRFVVGCNLQSKRTNPFVRFAVPALGLFYVLINFVVNGPCGMFSRKAEHNTFKDLAKEDPLAINPIDKRGFYFIVIDFIKFTLFLSTPLIHIVFMANVLLTTNWKYLWKLLRKIQRQMKLDDIFHCNLRRYCLFGIGLLILVNSSLANI